MTEGWASYWHARLLREATFLPHDLYLSAIKSHSDVVRPFASGQQLARSLNPYRPGFSLWQHIIDKHGLERARQICREEDDFGFVRNYLDQELADQLDLFVYEVRQDGDTKIASRDIHQIREAILASKFNYGAPRCATYQSSASRKPCSRRCVGWYPSRRAAFEMSACEWRTSPGRNAPYSGL